MACGWVQAANRPLSRKRWFREGGALLSNFGGFLPPMRFHALRHILRVGLKSILVHRLRSPLTILGIVLGVASVIVMLAVGEAAPLEAIQQIKDLGATNIIVRSAKRLDGDQHTRPQAQMPEG